MAQDDQVGGSGISGFLIGMAFALILTNFLDWYLELRRKSDIVQSVQRTTRYEWSDVRIVGCTVEHKTEGWKP